MYNLIFRLLSTIGARSGEVIKLKRKDINFPNHTLTLYGTKNGEDRVVGLGVGIEDALQAWCKDLPWNEYLFKGFSHKGESHVSQGMVNRMFKARCRKLGIEGVRHVHQLRNSALAHTLDAGAPLNRVREMVGHRKLETTALYLRACPSAQIKMINTYSPFERPVNSDMVIDRHKKFVETLRLDMKSPVKYEIKDSDSEYLFKVEK